MSPASKPLLEIKDLRTQFFLDEGVVSALDGIDLTVFEGESIGLVGETGCGKSMTALSVLGLVPHPGKITGGSVKFRGIELTKLSEEQMRGIRGAQISMIFQDPTSSLDPVFTVGSQIGEVISLHQEVYNKSALKKKVIDVLNLVKIAAPKTVIAQYPHELSGGMRQRVMIALALSCSPSLLIADEPTTALDVTIQAQVLSLLKDLVARVGSSMLLITHNLGIVAETCDRVCVMYAGKIVEESPTTELFDSPRHPYSVGLLKAFPKPGERAEELSAIKGTVPNLMNLPPGCPFAERCERAMDKCREVKPRMVEVSLGHRVACHLFDKEGDRGDG